LLLLYGARPPVAVVPPVRQRPARARSPPDDNAAGPPDAFTAAGFQVSVISEPQPVPAARELFPDEFRMLSTNPSFLFFVLHAV
jgi:hypothetical protein